jgi:hypothetical protein
MKTLASFADLMEAQLLRSRLESSGIPAFVCDENMAPLAAYAMGGVRVEVADEDFDRATQMLAEESEAKPEV